jgi:hypothetical protein
MGSLFTNTPPVKPGIEVKAALTSVAVSALASRHIDSIRIAISLDI